MKKFALIIMVLLFVIVFAGCAANSDSKTIKIGVSGTDTRIWDFVKKKAEKEGLKLEIVKYSDYVQPNQALASGDIDANAFQTISYFNTFKKERGLDLSPIGTTIIAPMGVYSDKYQSVGDIPDGAKIAVPNEATNMGRALLLLQSAGLLQLKGGFDGNGTLDAIKENPKNLEITAVAAEQTPRVLPDVAASVINNGIAVDAGLHPVKDSIKLEDETATPYINIIAARTEDRNREDLIKIVELYQADDTAEFIKKEFDGAQLPTFVPLKEIGE
ncbi:MetQ/NlpA family ABC transporter substrate-binding protein [Bacillus swezeyi]|uniref:Lipoprotein n=1 Tax=Bacillus swezeyi TaxID=1925020 RepID=A0A1R1QNF5_9BACI|nr:MetQ/NlpA family ABC transporter substrate-binding protein [Bacillus swezeyi]MEC1261803.1 MetQ/NlpA family ABC transporter substrate-binding protein [Bacillus swezeyi]MED2926334.1 MetQ/NlpA family ABC transporter substrate-binding protein [Bacillus swezeyi]MED2943804.1 MetQ/NlpA family ABC transporter substrate-binding protein [Bacillus swezeyi]MED2966103.1 MetQ/NlpA family ABC transporter substrate-binding protein [Bacillus swezeyi]MED2978732.1 MetQ/NlpA family ABC transporter substrate-bi